MPWRDRWRRRPRWEEDLGEELEAYLAHETDDNIARGMTPAAARAAACRKLGNTTLVQERIHAMRTVRPIDALWKDLTYAARLLRRAPAFSLAAMLSLALGIGANTAIFQLLDAVRLRTLPVDRPEELVRIDTAGEGGRMGQFTGRNGRMTNPVWEQIRDRHDGFSAVFAFGDATFNLAPAGEVRDVPGLWVSGSFFPALGVRPALGRLFTPADDRRGCPPAVVISHAFWQRELGGSPDVLSRTLTLARQQIPILGVAPAGFFGVEVGRSFDVALPVCSRPLINPANPGLDRRDFWWLTVMGRLAPGWPLERANAHLASMAPAVMEATLPANYREGFSEEYLALTLRASSSASGVSALRESYEGPLVLLMSLVGLVLLVACANLANLMLARASAREREIAVRLALGASRARIVVQLLVESLLLAAAGAAAGLVLARWLSAVLVGFLSTAGDAIFLDLTLDWRTLAFTAGLACLTCVLFGLAPALVATRRDVSAVTRAGGRGVTGGRERFVLRRALVVSQIALSLLLVTGALLFVRSLQNLTAADKGFRSDGVVTVAVGMRLDEYPVERRAAVHRTLLENLRAIPGVRGAAQAFITPLSGAFWNPYVYAGGSPPDSGTIVSFNQVSADYFRVMGMTLRAGRDFSDRDTPSSPLVAIVNERLARDLFEGANPIGRTIHRPADAGQPDAVYEIVGLVGDSKMRTLREELYPGVFLAQSQDKEPGLGTNYVLHSTTDVAALAHDVKRTIERTDPSLTMRLGVLQTRIDETLVQERLVATLSGCFGVLAGVLAVVGIYGLVAYMVARRRSEIGVRMALGAGRRDIRRLVLTEAAVLLAIGLAAGIPLTVGAARAVRALLFGLVPHDPVTIGVGVLGLAAAGLLASAWPAERASRTDPMVALREP